MLISFHLPKAAGKSFHQSLVDHFGNKILNDYSDYPMNTPRIKRNFKALSDSIKNRTTDWKDIQCIHGHFLPLKYRHIKHHESVKYITWMREPSERIASQYYYMLRNYTPEVGKSQPLYKRVIEENWTLEKYCLSPEFKNTCAQLLWGFPIEKFDFIGLVEDYDNDLEYFSNHFLHTKLQGYKKNYNPEAKPNSYFDDPELKDRVRKYHSLDIKLYEYAIRLKERRQIK